MHSCLLALLSSSSLLFACPFNRLFLSPHWVLPSTSLSLLLPPLVQVHDKPALVLAAEGNHSECAKVLLRGRADKDATYGDGLCAVHRCVHVHTYVCTYVRVVTHMWWAQLHACLTVVCEYSLAVLLYVCRSKREVSILCSN